MSGQDHSQSSQKQAMFKQATSWNRMHTKEPLAPATDMLWFIWGASNTAEFKQIILILAWWDRKMWLTREANFILGVKLHARALKAAEGFSKQ